MSVFYVYSRVVLLRSGPGRADCDAVIAHGGKFVRHPGILSKSDVISAGFYCIVLQRPSVILYQNISKQMVLFKYHGLFTKIEALDLKSNNNNNIGFPGQFQQKIFQMNFQSIPFRLKIKAT